MTKEMADDGTITDRRGLFSPPSRPAAAPLLPIIIRCCAVYQYHGSGDYSWSLSLFLSLSVPIFYACGLPGLKTDS
jgi:hypothetical protein